MEIIIKDSDIKVAIECRDDIECPDFIRILERLAVAGGFMKSGDMLLISKTE